MLGNIPPLIEKEMKRLEQIDARDRVDGTAQLKRLRQIPPETGRFLTLMAAAAPTGRIVEIGTSAGYSTLWLILAGREVGTRVTTFEILEEKVKLAEETFRLAGVEEEVELIHRDARTCLKDYTDISFCFLDAEKEVYLECYTLIIRNMVRGGLLIADNVISHKSDLQSFLDHVKKDDRVDSTILSIGKGLLFVRKR